MDQHNSQLFKLTGVEISQYEAWCKQHGLKPENSYSRQKFFKQLYQKRLAVNSQGHIVKTRKNGKKALE